MKKTLILALALLMCLSLLPLCALADGEVAEEPAAETAEAVEPAADTETPETGADALYVRTEEAAAAEPHVHDYQSTVTKERSCTEPGEISYTCKGCGDTWTETVPAGHAWGAWTVTQPATGTAEGEQARVCSVCGTAQTEVIPPLSGEWVRTDEGWQYRYSDGSYDKSLFVEIEGKTYYINDSGYLFLGSDWLEIDGVRRCFIDGAMATGLQKVDGSWYLFNEDGTTYTGWLDYEGAKYYYDTDTGRVASGWKLIDDVYYYFSPSDAKMTTGLKQINGSWYLFNEDGTVYTGWLDYGGAKYYYDTNTGKAASGWKLIDGLYYYFSPANAKMATGERKISGSWYLFNGDGTVYTGWLDYGGARYYYDTNSGILATGWKKIDGLWYYFSSGGKMQTGWHFLYGDYYYFYTGSEENPGPVGSAAYDVVIDGCQLQTDGTMVGGKKVYMSLNSYWYSSSTKYLIVVDTYTCKVGVYYGSAYNWKLQYFWDCSPGKASTPTVTGVFTVGDKGYYFDSYGSRCYWYTQFCGNYLFHSVLYNTDGTLQDGRLGLNLSHGCVRLAYNNAYWIYKNIPRGTTVVVY